MARPNPFKRAVRWQATDDGEFPYEAQIDGQHWVIRVNGFPEDPTVYTLLVDGQEAVDFNGWSKSWNRPKPKERSPEEEARHRVQNRRENRKRSRESMPDPRDAEDLVARNVKMYGDPDGPTFEQLVQRAQAQGKTGEEIWAWVARAPSPKELLRARDRLSESPRPDLRKRTLAWERTGDDEIPYRTEIDGQQWTVRVNGLEEPGRFTLQIDGEDVRLLDWWPEEWFRPPRTAPLPAPSVKPHPMSVTHPFDQRVSWKATGSESEPYAGWVEDQEWKIRVNDLPEHPRASYTLLVNDEELLSFDEWPAQWRVPAPPKATLEWRARRAADARHFDRARDRHMLRDPRLAEDLAARNEKVYGDPEGPTYDWLLEQGQARGVSGDALYEWIMEGPPVPDYERMIRDLPEPPEPHYCERPVRWQRTGDPEYPYETRVDGQRWVLRVDDYPNVPWVYALLVDGREVIYEDEWPEDWERPAR
jgi:hypothetical protein